MLKEVLFTHDDLDGAGCSVIFRLAHLDQKLGVDYDVINCSNYSVDKDVRTRSDIDRNTKIFFADLLCSEELLIELRDAGNIVNIFDHHLTNSYAVDVIPDARIVYVNDAGIMESGTSLLYQYYQEISMFMKDDPCIKYLFSDAVNEKLIYDFVNTIRSYDTYEWKNTNALKPKQFQTLFYLLGMNTFVEKYVGELSIPDSKQLIGDTERMFIDARLEMEQKFIDRFTPDDVIDVKVHGYRCALIIGYIGASISELGYQFLQKYPEYDIAALFMLGRNDGGFSFRCVKNNINLGKSVAGPMGGGGHPKAAGAPLPQTIHDEIVKMIIRSLKS